MENARGNTVLLEHAGTTRQPRRGTRAALRSSQTEALLRLANPAMPSNRLAGIDTSELRRMRLKVRVNPLQPTQAMREFTKTTVIVMIVTVVVITSSRSNSSSRPF